MFCAGHMLMSNGEGIAAGGTTAYSSSKSPWKGSKALYTFDFEDEKFEKQHDMSDGRWYPSVINTRGGYALIVGGFDAKRRELEVLRGLESVGTESTTHSRATASSRSTRTSS